MFGHGSVFGQWLGVAGKESITCSVLLWTDFTYGISLNFGLLHWQRGILTIGILRLLLKQPWVTWVHRSHESATSWYDDIPPQQHSRLIPMYNARFVLWSPSLSSPIKKMGRERRWPRWIKKGVAYRYQATVHNRTEHNTVLSIIYVIYCISLHNLGHLFTFWKQYKMGVILQTTFSNSFCH